MKRAACGIPDKSQSLAQKARTAAHLLHSEGPGRSTRELATQFQQLCADMAIKDKIRAGHWAVNGVILRIYALREIERNMTAEQMRTMIDSMTVYLGTTTPVPQSGL